MERRGRKQREDERRLGFDLGVVGLLFFDLPPGDGLVRRRARQRAVALHPRRDVNHIIRAAAEEVRHDRVVFRDAVADGDQAGRISQQALFDELVVVVEDLDADVDIVGLFVVVEKVADLGVGQGGTVDGHVVVGGLFQHRIFVVQPLAQLAGKRGRRANLFVGEEVIEEIIQILFEPDVAIRGDVDVAQAIDPPLAEFGLVGVPLAHLERPGRFDHIFGQRAGGRDEYVDVALPYQRGDDLPQPRGDDVGGAGEVDRRVVVLHLLADLDTLREVGCLKAGRRVAVQ